MKVSGFTFIKNAVKYQYPIAEAIRSILPLCDEVIVAVGDCSDGTRELVASIDQKIKIIDTIWDENLQQGGRVLAAETDKAFHAIGEDVDWCVYIQGDEVLHEDGLKEIQQAMLQWKDDKNIDGLLLNYKHFYGSYDYVGASTSWYPKEIRIIKNNKKIYSYRDAQGFRKEDDKKLRVKALQASMFHYGWVREPKVMQAKQNNSSRFWHGDASSEEAEKNYSGDFDYSQIDALEKFTGKHPAVMQPLIDTMNWTFSYDLSYNNYTLKDRIKLFLEKLTGKRFFDYQNYILV